MIVGDRWLAAAWMVEIVAAVEVGGIRVWGTVSHGWW
ncbi:MAG: hypothetical protein FD127_3769, partial [Acidimicrobiaceae bacterium]